MTIKHRFVSTQPDGANPLLVRASPWNDDHDGTNAHDHSSGTTGGTTVVRTVRHAAGVPAGAPTGTELPIAFDSTAVTGGVYYWTGAAWVKGGTI